MSNSEAIKEVQSAKRKSIEKAKDIIVSEKNEKLRQIPGFQLSLLKENLRQLQQFRKLLIQKRSYLILLPLQAFDSSYDQPLDLIRGKDNQSWQIKYKKLGDYDRKIMVMLKQHEKQIRDVLIKKQKIKEEIQKEKQGCQIYQFRLNQFIQIGQHYNCLLTVQNKIYELSAYLFNLIRKTARFPHYQTNQELSIQSFKQQFLNKQAKIRMHLQWMHLIQQRIRYEDQVFQPNNEIIKILIPIQIERYNSLSMENLDLINGLKQFIQIKRQKFSSYYNYNFDDQSSKITIEQFLKQFYAIEMELRQNEEEIEYIISCIKKYKDIIVSEKNEKLRQSVVDSSNYFHKYLENDYFK